jgi:hypothetical protein
MGQVPLSFRSVSRACQRMAAQLPPARAAGSIARQRPALSSGGRGAARAPRGRARPGRSATRSRARSDPSSVAGPAPGGPGPARPQAGRDQAECAVSTSRNLTHQLTRRPRRGRMRTEGDGGGGAPPEGRRHAGAPSRPLRRLRVRAGRRRRDSSGSPRDADFIGTNVFEFPVIPSFAFVDVHFVRTNEAQLVLRLLPTGAAFQ